MAERRKSAATAERMLALIIKLEAETSPDRLYQASQILSSGALEAVVPPIAGFQPPAQQGIDTMLSLLVRARQKGGFLNALVLIEIISHFYP